MSKAVYNVSRSSQKASKTPLYCVKTSPRWLNRGPLPLFWACDWIWMPTNRRKSIKNQSLIRTFALCLWSQKHPKMNRNYVKKTFKSQARKPQNMSKKPFKSQAQRHQNRGPEGSGEDLEAAWAVLSYQGRLWKRLGPSWERLGGTWKRLGPSWARKKVINMAPS